MNRLGVMAGLMILLLARPAAAGYPHEWERRPGPDEVTADDADDADDVIPPWDTVARKSMTGPGSSPPFDPANLSPGVALLISVAAFALVGGACYLIRDP
jgi:hypothetical protein